MKLLPDKPSELLALALHDLEAVERDPRYVVDMGAWHSPNGKCAVCFAGAVMAGTLGANIDDLIEPHCFPLDSRRKLYALNRLRTGRINAAFLNLGISLPKSIPVEDGNVASYDNSPEAFKNDMAGLIGILQAEGL